MVWKKTRLILIVDCEAPLVFKSGIQLLLFLFSGAFLYSFFFILYQLLYVNNSLIIFCFTYVEFDTLSKQILCPKKIYLSFVEEKEIGNLTVVLPIISVTIFMALVIDYNIT